MLLSASATPACHPLLLDEDIPPATVPLALCRSCFLLLPWVQFPPQLGWVLPSGYPVRYFFSLCCGWARREPPSLWILGLVGIHTLWCPAPNPTAAAKKTSLCSWPKPGTAKEWCWPSSKHSNHALAMQPCRKAPVWEKHPLVLVPAAVWQGWTPVRSRASVECFAAKLVGD